MLPTAGVDVDLTGQTFGLAVSYHVWVFRPQLTTPMLKGEFLMLLGQRYEFIIVGNKPRNARFVAVIRPTLAP
jgi:hypothetical protein